MVIDHFCCLCIPGPRQIEFTILLAFFAFLSQLLDKLTGKEKLSFKQIITPSNFDMAPSSSTDIPTQSSKSLTHSAETTTVNSQNSQPQSSRSLTVIDLSILRNSQAEEESDDIPSIEHTNQAIALILSAHVRYLQSVPIRFTKTARRAHFLTFRLRWLFSLAALVLVLTTFLEPPSHCVYEFGAIDCFYKHRTESIIIPSLHPAITLSIEFVCLTLLVIEVGLYMYTQGPQQYFKRPLHIAIVIFLSLYSLDFYLVLLFTILGKPWVQIAPYLRIIFLGIRNRQIRRQIWLIIQLLPQILLIILMIGFTIVAFGFLGIVIFPKVLEDVDYNSLGNKFGLYLEILWRIFTNTPTTTEFEEIRNMNIAYFLFFLVFAIITVLFMSNLLTAVVFDGYRNESQDEILEEKGLVEEIINEAWHYLDVQNRRYLNEKQIKFLLKNMRSYNQFRKLLNPDTFNLVFWILDANSNGRIDKQEFSQILTILKLRFDLFSNKTFIHRWFPQFSSSKTYKWMCELVSPEGYVVGRTRFEVIVSVVLGIITLLSILDIVLVFVQKAITPITIAFEFVVFIAFLIEAILRIVVLGWKRYWSEHKFQLFFLVIQLIPCVVFLAIDQENLSMNIGTQEANLAFLAFYFFALPLPASLRFFRTLMFIPFVRAVFGTFVVMVQASYKLVYVLFCIIYFLSVLGVQLFGDLSEDDNVLTRMMNMSTSFMFFSDVLYSNQITNAGFQYKDLYESGVVWIFFVIAQIIMVYICLNLVVSYTISTFLEEMERRTYNYGQDPTFQFFGSKVYFSGDIIPDGLTVQDADTVRATLPMYLSAHIDKIKTVHSIFERKMLSIEE
eukprot:TRINITY_DN4164_c1_g1_i7.p1 TRINITY_DN4164_c1_g1~~TRINITY_DN4164_c1_g1_i7.p1  ORF type:complete len:840 (-),score=24.16 TRINITY_DN4164_c1_g1_i7:266-2785(-)